MYKCEGRGTKGISYEGTGHWNRNWYTGRNWFPYTVFTVPWQNSCPKSSVKLKNEVEKTRTVSNTLLARVHRRREGGPSPCTSSGVCFGTTRFGVLILPLYVQIIIFGDSNTLTNNMTNKVFFELITMFKMYTVVRKNEKNEKWRRCSFLTGRSVNNG